eukprot:53317_1
MASITKWSVLRIVRIILVAIILILLLAIVPFEYSNSYSLDRVDLPVHISKNPLNITQLTVLSSNSKTNEWSNKYPERSEDCKKQYTETLLERARNETKSVCINQEEDYARCSSKHTLSSCHFQNVTFTENKKWLLSCQLSTRSEDYFPKYWYNSGPGHMFLPDVSSNHIFDNKSHEQCSEWIDELTILITGECGGNMFHSFSEFFDWYLIRHLYHVSDDNNNIRYILRCGNNHNETYNSWAPIYFSKLSKYPIMSLNDLKSNTCFRHLVIGRQMMGWYNFWESLGNCQSVPIFLSFRSFWIDAFHEYIDGHEEPQDDGNIVENDYHFCWLERVKSARGWPQYSEYFNNFERNIMKQDQHKSLFKHVTMDVVTPGLYNQTGVIAQFQSIQKCDVLAGVHGAGMTWLLMMRNPGIIIYVKPMKEGQLTWDDCEPNKPCYHDGFINWARMLGHTVLVVAAKDDSTTYGGFQKQTLHGVDKNDLTQKIIEAIQIIKVNRR